MLSQQKRRRTFIITSFITIQVALSIFGGVVLGYSPTQDTIFQGIQINQVDVGGLTKEAAFAKLKQHLEPNLISAKLKIKWADKDWNLAYQDIGVAYNLSEAIEEAYLIGRQNNLLIRALSNFELSRRKHNLKIVPQGDSAIIIKKITKLALVVDKPAVDAQISLVGDQFHITPEQAGLKVDVSASIVEVEKAITKQSLNPVILVVKDVNPKLKTADLNHIKDLLAVYATSFNLHNVNRVNNVKLATKEINGVVVKSGGIFSFNEKVGPRMQKYGYKEAPVISNNRLVQGIGGGVCQVSTTLYQAVALSGLSISERFHHSKPVSYVPIGQDAAVADNQLDLKFTNNRKKPILILSEVRGDQLIVRIFGQKEAEEPTVNLTSEEVKVVEPQVVIKKDPTLSNGLNKIIAAGEKGYKVKVYRVLSDNNKMVKKELLSNDYYRSSPTVIRVGTRPGKVANVK